MASETQARPQANLLTRAGLLTAGILILAGVYLFQRINAGALFGNFSADTNFIINRTIRLILNDFACFLLIFALFQEKKYMKMAFWVFLAELLVILPIYLVVKLGTEGASEISSPLLSQIHRLIVNPMLMFLLIAGFVYQRFAKK